MCFGLGSVGLGLMPEGQAGPCMVICFLMFAVGCGTDVVVVCICVGGVGWWLVRGRWGNYRLLSEQKTNHHAWPS